MIQFKWEGVFPAFLTPFTTDDKIDLPLFEKNLNAQVQAGIDGIVLGGTLGEASVLQIEEKEQLVKFAIEKSAGRLPVILNIAEGSTREAVKQASMATKWGADGLMLLPPMRYSADPRETVEYFTTIAKSTDLPIMLYNNPVDYKTEITIPMFEALAKVTNINAVKESTRNVMNVTRMRNAFGSRYSILCGVDTLALEELCLGADGWVAGLCDAFPAETVAIYKLAKAGRIQEAVEIYRWFMPLLELDIHPKLVQYIKLAATMTGICTEDVRPPRLPLVGEERQRITSIIQKGLETRPQLPKL